MWCNLEALSCKILSLLLSKFPHPSLSHLSSEDDGALSFLDEDAPDSFSSSLGFLLNFHGDFFSHATSDFSSFVSSAGAGQLLNFSLESLSSRSPTAPYDLPRAT